MGRLTRDVLEKLAYVVGVGLVIFGSSVPGREVAIGGGMSLIASTVGAKALSSKTAERKEDAP